jgi:hypothetical protein
LSAAIISLPEESREDISKHLAPLIETGNEKATIELLEGQGILPAVRNAFIKELSQSAAKK